MDHLLCPAGPRTTKPMSAAAVAQEKSPCRGVGRRFEGRSRLRAGAGQRSARSSAGEPPGSAWRAPSRPCAGRSPSISMRRMRQMRARALSVSVGNGVDLHRQQRRTCDRSPPAAWRMAWMLRNTCSVWVSMSRPASRPVAGSVAPCRTRRPAARVPWPASTDRPASAALPHPRAGERSRSAWSPRECQRRPGGSQALRIDFLADRGCTMLGA